MSTRPADGHLGDLVVDLADGNLGGADPALALAHLDSCPDCRAELADAVVSAAALREFAAPVPEPLSIQPLPDSAVTVPTWTPPVEAEPGDAERARTARPGTSRRAVALAAAVALLAGVGIGAGALAVRADGRPPPAAETLLLRSGTSPRGAAVLTAAGGTRRMTIVVDGVKVPSGTVLVVWLSGGNAVPLRVGTLDASGRGTFGMTADTASQFAEVVLTDQTPQSAAVMDAAAIVATAALQPDT